MWNLIWHINFDDLHTNCQINIHQYEFFRYYKPLAYHFIKLKFVKFEVNSSNLFPVNISGYTVAQNFGGQKLWQIHPSRYFGGKNFGGWWQQIILISVH